MGELERKIAQLRREVEDLQACMGVLVPVLEREVEEAGWDLFSRRD
jgi:hypothetical protein